jgi:hypothetical protein
MTNNKQQTAVEWFIEELEYKGDLRETPSIRNIQLNIDTSDYMDLKQQAKEMYQDEIEAAIINDCAEQSTSEASKYAEGYTEGYQRALDYMTDTIKNKIEVMENANNEFKKGTANTTNTTFLCTQFIAEDRITTSLPNCIRCGKPQYQHPIITNTI